MTERCPCLAARYRGATWTNSSRFARKLIVDLTLPPRLVYPCRAQGDITREANSHGRVTFFVSQVAGACQSELPPFLAGVELIFGCPQAPGWAVCGKGALAVTPAESATSQHRRSLF